MTGLGALWALLLSVALLVFGTNLQGVLLPILGEERGAGMTAIGLFSSAWSTGFVVACLLIGRLVGRFGHVRAFLLLALVSAGAAFLLLLHQSSGAWIGLRLVIGFCFGGLSAIVESWLIERAGSGPAFASYMTITLLASLGGTLCLNIIDPGGPAPFVLMIVSVAASSIPVLFTRVAKPAPVPPFRLALGRLCRRSPVGSLGVIAAGLITGAIGGLGPVFGMESGLSMNGDTLMLAANSVGGALAYAPVGLLAERMDRRVLLGGTSVLGLLICLPLALTTQFLTRGMVIALFGLFGFAQYPLYGLSVGIVNSQSDRVSATQISSELLLLFGLGAIIGPLAGAQIMRAGINLFAFIGFVLAMLLAGTITQRMLARGAANRLAGQSRAGNPGIEG
jgi:MFS family permease